MKIIAGFLFWSVIVVDNFLGTRTELNASQLTSKIIQGNPGNSETFLYMASLQLDGEHICSASMFERGFLLSSAKCIRYIQGQRHILRDTAVIGSKYLEKGVKYDIIDLIIHPQFNIYSEPPKHSNADVGVVTIEITNHLLNVPLTPLYKNKYDVRAQSVGTVCGWGSVVGEDFKAYGRANHSTILNCLEVNIHGRGYCHQRIRGIDFKRKHICGTGKHPHQGISLGDTGSPLTLNAGQPGELEIPRSFIIAVTSGQIESPGGYIIHFVRTSELYDDIQKLKDILKVRMARRARLDNNSRENSTKESNKRIKRS